MHRPSAHALMAALLPALFAALAGVAPALGRTYTITTTLDDGGVVNGSCTLREAIRAARDDVAADACPAGDHDDVILLPDGTYRFAGAEPLASIGPLTIRGMSGDPAAVVVDLQNEGRFLNASLPPGSPAGLLALADLTVRNGRSSMRGGAIHASRYALVLDRVTFASNRSEDWGGAVYFAGGGGAVLTVNGSTFVNNTARGGGGGLAAFVASSGSALLRDVLFQTNVVEQLGPFAYGGGLYLRADAPTNAWVSRCRFVMNRANNTGGASSNHALGGGAYFQAVGGAVDVDDSHFFANTAGVAADVGASQVAAIGGDAGAGGVIDLDRLHVDASFSNFANGSADVSLYADSLATVRLNNSQITYGSWNGLQAYTFDGAIDVGHVTVADYPAGTGATLDTRAGGSIWLQSSLLALNATDLVILGGGVAPTGNCIAMPGDFPGFVSVGEANYRLTATSAAVDATFRQATTRAHDRDHGQRVLGVQPDCGAYEHGALFAEGFEEGHLFGFAASAPR